MNSALSQLLNRVVSFYAKTLAESPQCREKLSTLGVRNASLLEQFSVGLVAGKLPNITPRRGPALEQLKQLGIMDATGHERFVGTFTVPVFDLAESVVQIAFYAPDGSVSWLLDSAPTFWNAAALEHSPAVTLARDPLAALRFVQDGNAAVIAIGGPAEALLGKDARELLALHRPHVTIVSEDKAWAEKMSKILAEAGATVGAGEGEPATAGERIVEQDASGLTIEFPHRVRFVLQGLVQDSARHLRASVKIFQAKTSGEPRLHLDTLDLYHAKSRLAFSRTASVVLGLDPAMIEEYASRAVLLCERFLKERDKPAPAPVLSDRERNDAMALLQDPRLLDRVLEALSVLGFVGEQSNKLLAYVAATSRKLQEPLSILTVSRSGAGKSTLAEAVASLFPPEDVLRLTRLTPQTLFYQRPDALSHKLVVVEEETGLQEAAYAARVLMSAGSLRLSSAAGFGGATTREVRGPASVFVTTTRTDVDEETAGRFLILTADESDEQTEKILHAQREAEARPPQDREKLLQLHQNAQRLIRPLSVVNPFAPHLTFPHSRLCARRDHKRYLALIRAVTLLHQHQRKIENESVVTQIRDIEIANRLAIHVLGQSLSDLSAPSRRLLVQLQQWLSQRAAEQGKSGAGEVRFTRRQLREQTGWKRTQLEEHLRELVAAEYVIVLTGGSQGRITEYRLDWDGRQGMEGEKFLRGLVDPEQLVGLVGTCRRTPDKFKTSPTGQEIQKTEESAKLVGLSEGEG
jgi:energy-coupling factor transporter ATP-binding protein EcfA2